jgi:hypothetical protein
MDDVREMQARFDRAELTADRDTLRDLIAEDSLSIGPRGFVLDEQQWIDRHDEFRYEQLRTSEMDARWQLVALQFSPLTEGPSVLPGGGAR